MTHVSGHIDWPNESFGVLYPVETKEENQKEIPELVDPSLGIHYPVLFTNSKKFTRGDKVAFQPYLIPWENKYLVIAGDVVSWEDHIMAEKEAFKNVKNGKTKFEDLDLVEDKAIIEQIRNAPTKNKDYAEVIKKSLKYLETESFRELYKNKKLSNNGRVQFINETTVRLEETGILYTLKGDDGPRFIKKKTLTEQY
jgi:hypothetical protein